MTETQNDPNTAREDDVKRHNRRQMIVIMMIGFVTLGGSYTAYYFAQNSDGWGTTNNGTFIEPPVNTEQLGWQVEGDTRHWWLWVVSEDCQQDCQGTVKNMQALQILLNREMDRVRRGYTDGNPGPLDWTSNFPALARIAVQDVNAIEAGVYIVDPHGNLVLHYTMDINPKLVLQDLKKLLKVSHIG